MNWKDVEKSFQSRIKSFGKDAYIHKFTDTAEVRASTKGQGKAKKQPSDYIVVEHGVTYFAEVKRCETKTSFPFSRLSVGQLAAAKKIERAGGHYYVFVYSVARAEWFRLPAFTIEEQKKKGRKSLPWTEILTFKWT